MTHTYSSSSDQISYMASGGWCLIGQTPIHHAVTEVTSGIFRGAVAPLLAISRNSKDLMY